MNQKRIKTLFSFIEMLREWSIGILQLLGIILLLIILFLILVFLSVYLKARNLDDEAEYIIVFVLIIWLVTSPFVCLFWIFKPAEWFWWKHKYISYAISIGGFLGSIIIIVVGVHPFLRFLPDKWLFEKELGLLTSYSISMLIGLISTCAIWYILVEHLEKKREKNRLKRIEWQRLQLHFKYRGFGDNLVEDLNIISGFKQEIQKLEQMKKNKLSPFLESKLTALKQICENYKNDLNNSTPDSYGGEKIDEPIEEITEDVLNECVESQQQNNAESNNTKKERLKEFLKNLPRTERLFVVLYYYEEMTISEIAKVLEMPSSTVSQMQSSIIAKCKTYMREKNTMNNNLLKIGIDLDDTITYCPQFFSLMTNAMKNVTEIHIFTNREQTPESESNIRNELSELDICYHHLVITGDKAEYILKNGISVFFDDTDEYLVNLPESVRVFKIREPWNFDFDKHVWK
jgi:RNA polymerase sigma factor (sigma-70 family)